MRVEVERTEGALWLQFEDWRRVWVEGNGFMRKLLQNPHK